MKNLLFILSLLLSVSSFSQVVINEVMNYPTNPQGLITYNGSTGKEYIELYNPSCSPVNVSGYFISSRQDFAGTISGGTFRIPNVAAATIPPNGHLVIGTANSCADPASVDIQIPSYTSNYCQNSATANFILANADGWVGLSNAAGIPVDAIYWSSATGNISQTADYGGVPCTPSGSPAGVVLKSAQQINSGFPGVLNYVGNTPTQNTTFSRIPDGGTWQRNIAASINNLTVGNCNGGTCVTAAVFYTPAVVSQPSCGGSNGSIVINPNPSGTYAYTWTPNVSSTNSASSLVAGSYTINVNANGCQKDTTITLVSGSGPTAVVTTPTNPGCGASNGQVVIGTVSGGVAPYQYNFNGLGYSSITTYSGLAAGSYTLLVKDANGCIYTASNVVLTSTSGPTAVASTPSNPSCGASNGQIVIGTVTGGVSPYQYNFNGLGYSSTTTYTGLAAGSFSLLVKDANGCIYTASNIVLTSGSGPTAIITTPTNPSCGASDGQVLLGNVTGGVGPYQYNFNNLGYTASTSYTGLGAGTYTLVVKDANGCTYNAANIILSNGTGPTAIVVTPTNPSCGGINGQVVLGVVTGGVSPYQYNFNATGYSSTTTYSGLSSGTFTLSVQDANGCVYNASNIILTNGNGPSAIVTTIVNEKCTLSNGQVTLGNVTGGVSPYQYNFNNLGYSNTTLYSGLSAGSYSLLVKDVNGCILTANNIVITNATGPTNVSISKVDEKCSGSNGQITIGNVTGGTAPYQFDFNEAGYNATLVHSNLPANSYTLSVVDANGCEFISPNIDLLNTPGPTDIDITFVDAKCEKDNGSIQVNSVVGGQAAYLFSLNNSTFSNTIQYNSLSAGQYLLKVKDANGCIYQQTVIISNFASPVADFDYSPMVISSEAQDVTTTNTSVGSIINYQWTAPNGSPINGNSLNFTTNFNIQTEGSYPITLIVENQSGCIDSITKYVNVKIDPTIYIPNTFTPDGDAFNNSWIYYLNGYDIEKFTMRIFNRWGEIVWESKDPSIYWDGTYGGNLVQSGTYTWTLNVKDDNTDEVYYYRGHLNVIY